MADIISEETSIWDPKIIRQAIVDSLRKLDPRVQFRNPVMFIVEIGSVITTIAFVNDLRGGTGALFTGQVAAWLWFTVLFANFAEAMAEGPRQGAGRDASQGALGDTRQSSERDGQVQQVPSSMLRSGDIV